MNNTTVPNGQEPNFYIPYSLTTPYNISTLSTSPYVDGWFYNCAQLPSNYSNIQASNYINWGITPMDLKGNVNIPFNAITQIYVLIYFPAGTYIAGNLPFITCNCLTSTTNVTVKYNYSLTSLVVSNVFNSGQNQVFQCVLQPSLVSGETIAFGNTIKLNSTITGSITASTTLTNITINTSALPTYASATVTPSPQNFIVQDIFVELTNQGGTISNMINQTVDYKFTAANVLNKYLYRVVNDMVLQNTKSTMSTVYVQPNYLINSSLSYIG